ncbi:D-aminoacyl-tRNA deacylase [Zongyangia hominis]|uniref:D-aminoacyl-tRNA deacylase n=1 Tax=Zongyangia hominis TaxID=2763677 RepID=A0A926EB66_9FIRM|nr:D-aminoacyl-tRNA deacylase [Zongyangia hominis]MBC8569815.1 D-tyrosyl-tRNA(Tyr) deacylase [Zongyangia hominis]
MRVVLQRVRSAGVRIGGEERASIGQGLMALVGVCGEDGERQADYLCEKIANLRIFEDDGGKMNRSLLDIGGGMIVVSNFTLYADCKKGRRPSFVRAGDPGHAQRLYDYFVARMGAVGVRDVQTGEFGADMLLSIENDGPVTIVLDTDELM